MPSDSVTYVGHATTLIDVAGTRLLTDPVLRPRIGHLRRIAPPPPPAQRLAPDAILVSHAHHDHLDVPSLRTLPPEVPLVAPAGCVGLLRRRTAHDVRVAVPGERVRIGTTEVLVVDAVHDGRRLPFGGRRAAVGFVVEGPPRVYFAGDTDLFDGMRELSGAIDVALLPVWGWGPRVDAGHMTPEQAADAAAMLRPRVAVPIHWGTLASPRVHWRAQPAMPATRFADAVARVAPDVSVRILAPGDQMAVAAGSAGSAGSAGA